MVFPETNDPGDVTARSQSSIAIGVLDGSLEVGGAAVTMTPRERELVVALAIRRACGAQELADMLWPEADGDQGRGLLKVYVHRVRRRAGSRLIAFRRGCYLLAPEAVIDIESIGERLTGSGDAELAYARRLRSERHPDASRWRWFQARSEHLRDIGRRHALRIARERLLGGDASTALAIADELSAEDACDDEAHDVAIRSHLLRGENAAVIRRYRRYADALRLELGIEPSAEIRRLLEPPKGPRAQSG